jgi:hypothetical protein
MRPAEFQNKKGRFVFLWEMSLGPQPIALGFLVLLVLLVSTILAPDTTLRPVQYGSSFYYLVSGEVPAAKLHPSAPKRPGPVCP